MARPDHSRAADRARLALLMRRRALTPAHACRFPDPPPDFSGDELVAWDWFRSGFRATGVVDAGHFACVEILVDAYTTGTRLRALRDKTADETRRSLLAGEISRQDQMLRTTLDMLAPTKAMLVRLAMNVPGLVDRLGLPARDRRRIQCQLG